MLTSHENWFASLARVFWDSIFRTFIGSCFFCCAMDWDTITHLFGYAKENMDKMCLEISLENWTLALNSSDQTIKCLEDILNSVYHCLSFALYNRAKAFLGTKKFFRSKRDCERILAARRSSRDLGIGQASAAFDADVFTIFGRCLHGLSQIDLAKSAFRQALILDPHNLEAKQNLDKCVNLNVPSLPSLQRLPDELWIQIFANLDVSSLVGSELVCKKWSALTPYSWYKVKLVPDDVWPSKSPSSIPPSYFVGILKKCGQFCTAIDLGSVDVSRVRLEGQGRFRLRNKLNKLFEAICQSCPNLESLTVPNAAILDRDLSQLLSNLRLLKVLSMEKICRTPEGHFTGESLAEAPEALTEIRLHFANSCPSISDRALSKIAEKLGPNLTDFKLFSDWDSFVGEQALCDFLGICSNLTTIKLGCLGREAAENLSTTCLEKLANLRKLKVLYLWIVRITSSVVGKLVENCQSLTSIECHTEIMDLEALTSLSKFKNLTDLRLDIVNGLPWATLLPTYARQNGSTLKILALNAVHASELPPILELFPRLEQLCMWNSVDVKTATLIDLIQKFKDSKTNPIKLIASCYQVQMDQPLIAVLKKVPQFSVGCYYEHKPCDLA